MRRLNVISGPAAGQTLEIEQETVIGREGADLTIGDDEMSRRHAALRPTEDGVEVEDLGSLNGTFVDDKRLEGPATLGGNAVLRLGTTRIALEIELAEGSAETRIARPDLTVPRRIPEPDVTAPRAIPEPDVTAPRAIPEPDVTAPRAIPEPDVTAPRAIPEPDVTAPRAIPQPDVTAQREVPQAPADAEPPPADRPGASPAIVIALGVALVVLVVVLVLLLV